MSKARTLAGVVSTGAVLADGVIDAAEIGSLTLPTGGDIVGTTSTQTLTNKTIDIASNTLTGVQASLVSGTSIKTVNGDTLLGNGDLVVGGGSLILLSSITAVGAATVDIETTFNSTYDAYMIVASGVTFDSATAVACRMKIGGAYVTDGTYYWHTNISKSDLASYAGSVGASSNTIRMADFGTGAAPTVSNLVIMVYVPASTTLYKTITWEGISNRGDRAETGSGVARNDGTAALTGIRLYGFNGSSLISGKFRLYGIANS